MPITFLVKKTPEPDPDPDPFIGTPISIASVRADESMTTYSESLERMICAYGERVATGVYELYYSRVNTDNDSLSAGSPVYNAWGVGRYHDCIIEPISGTLVIGWSSGDGLNIGRCGTHEFVGESYINSTTTTFNPTRRPSWVNIVHIPNTNKVAFVYVDSLSIGAPGPITIRIGEVVYENYFGDDQWYVKIIGSPVVVVNEGEYSFPSAIFDPDSNQLIIAYQNKDTNNVDCVTCQIDNDGVVTFGSPSVFATDAFDPDLSYDSIAQKIVLTYVNDDNWHGEVRVGTVDGTSIIDIGSPVVFCEDIYHLSSTFDPHSGRVVISYRDDDLSPSQTNIITGKVTGNSITFDSPISFDNACQSVSIAYDPKNKLVVTTYSIANPAYTVKAFSARFAA